jgi:hypothetical protein
VQTSSEGSHFLADRKSSIDRAVIDQEDLRIILFQGRDPINHGGNRLLRLIGNNKNQGLRFMIRHISPDPLKSLMLGSSVTVRMAQITHGLKILPTF